MMSFQYHIVHLQVTLLFSLAVFLVKSPPYCLSLKRRLRRRPPLYVKSRTSVSIRLLHRCRCLYRSSPPMPLNSMASCFYIKEICYIKGPRSPVLKDLIDIVYLGLLRIIKMTSRKLTVYIEQNSMDKEKRPFRQFLRYVY